MNNNQCFYTTQGDIKCNINENFRGRSRSSSNTYRYGQRQQIDTLGTIATIGIANAGVNSGFMLINSVNNQYKRDEGQPCGDNGECNNGLTCKRKIFSKGATCKRLN